MNKIRRIWFVLLVFGLPACKPRVFYFTATPRIVSSKDSVRLSWKTTGKAEMIFYQDRISNPPGDSADMLEFVLTARKWGKTSAPFKQSVKLVPQQSRDVLSFSLTGQEGDTLIAAGIKDTNLYRGFVLISIASLSHRPIIVVHNGMRAVLSDSGVAVTALRDIPYDGLWTLKSVLTPAEKGNKALIPNTLDAMTIIKPINH
jgi:hypothetical protein